MKTITAEKHLQNSTLSETDKSLGHNAFLNPQTLKHISLELIVEVYEQ